MILFLINLAYEIFEYPVGVAFFAVIDKKRDFYEKLKKEEKKIPKEEKIPREFWKPREWWVFRLMLKGFSERQLIIKKIHFIIYKESHAIKLHIEWLKNIKQTLRGNSAHRNKRLSSQNVKFTT